MSEGANTYIIEEIDRLLSVEDFEEATRVLSGQPDEPWVHALRADVAFEQGDHVTARAYYKLALDGGVDDVALRLGNLLADANEFAEAERIYRLAANRGDPVGWRNLALTVQEADAAAAERYFRRAVEMGDRRSALLLGELQLDDGRVAEAEETLGSALAAGEGEAAIALGLMLREAGRVEEAESVFRRGVSADAGREVVPYLGALLNDLGRSAEALVLYRTALDVDPDHGDVLLNLANILAKRDDEESREDAEALYRRAADLGVVEAHNNLGMLLAECGRNSEAQQAYERGIALGDELAAENLRALTRGMKALRRMPDIP